MMTLRRHFLLLAATVGTLLSACAQTPNLEALDPFSPNWTIEETRLTDNRVRIELSMKRYYSGGAGEARAMFERRAKALMSEGGYKAYEVVEYLEGLDSSMFGSKRTATGVIRLTNTAN